VFIGDGKRVLCKVLRVDGNCVIVLAHPQVELILVLDEGEDATRLTSPGEILTIDCVIVDDYIMTDFVNEDTDESLPVLPGGPPWLLPPVREERPTEHDLADLVERMGVDDSPEMKALRLENLELRASLSQRDEELREKQRALLASQRINFPRLFDDEEEQFRFEVHFQYLVNEPASERAVFPFDPEFKIGEDFLESMNRHVANGAISRQKVTRVCAEVVSKRVWQIPSRNAKQWKDPWTGRMEERPGTQGAYRVRLQSETPNARRLKFWMLQDGHVEFDMVGGHDEGIE
jgi:hypothetical protein